MPYTHPMQVRDFKIVMNDAGIFVVSGGGEGIIRTWKFDPMTNKFENIAAMEGHTRAVTCLLLCGTSLCVCSRCVCEFLFHHVCFTFR
jgi:hypothetical protein